MTGVASMTDASMTDAGAMTVAEMSGVAIIIISIFDMRFGMLNIQWTGRCTFEFEFESNWSYYC